MSTELSIKSELEKGAWVVRDLAMRFGGALRRKVSFPLRECNLTELSVAHYRRVDLQNFCLETHEKALKHGWESGSELIRMVIEGVIHEEHSSAKLVSFSESEAAKIARALECIRDTDAGFYALLYESISLFLRFQSTNFRSASHPHLFGSILIGDGIEKQTSESVAISIVHEFAHQELFLINLIDRLVNEEFDGHEIHAPFQGRVRPPIARLHSLWALYRMVQYQKVTGEVDQRHLELLSYNAKSFADGELTSLASTLVSIASKAAV